MTISSRLTNQNLVAERVGYEPQPATELIHDSLVASAVDGQPSVSAVSRTSQPLRDSGHPVKLSDLEVQRIFSGYPMVLRIVHAMRFRNVDMADALGGGLFGLVCAAGRFDDSLNDSFIGYATNRVKGAAIDEIRRYYKLRRDHGSIPQELTLRPDTLPLDAPMSSSTSRTLADIIPDARLSVEDLVIKDEERRELISLLKTCLTETEQRVIMKYYFDDALQTAIAEELGVSESRISQIRKQALKKLRLAAATMAPVS